MIAQTTFNRANLIVLAAIVAIGGAVLALEGYAGDVSLGFALYGAIMILAAGYFTAFEISTRRLVLLAAVAALDGWLVQRIGTRGGWWSYAHGDGFVPATFVLAALVGYGLTQTVIGGLVRRVIGAPSRAWNLVIVAALVAGVIALGGPAAYFAGLAVIGGALALRMPTASLIAVLIAGALVGGAAELAGAHTGLWRFPGELPPAWLVLAAWPLELLAHYAVSGALARESLIARPGYFHEPVMYARRADHPMACGDRVHRVVSVHGDDKHALLDDALARADLAGALARTCAELGRTAEALAIAIKPNLMFLYSERDRSTFTDPALVEHLVDWLRARGYTNLSVVESQSAYGNFFLARGVAHVAEVAGYRPRGRYRIVDLTEDMVLHTFDGPLGAHFVGRAWRDAEFRISFAKNKTHTWAWYTLCLKNIYGVLPLQDKIREYHNKREIYYPAIDMLVAFPVQFGIVDAFTSADGPFGIFADRSPNPTRTILAGESLVAVDWAGASKMGLDPMVSRYMQLAVQVFGRPNLEVVGDASVYPEWCNVTRPVVELWDNVEESYGFTNTVFGLLNHDYVSPAFPRRPRSWLFRAAARLAAPLGGLVYQAPPVPARSALSALPAGPKEAVMPSYARLSSPIENLEPHYDVVVIGSGYGGGIAASRLARAGRRVCLLERGKERRPGEMPDTEHEAIDELQLHTAHGRLHPQGLYDLRLFDDINVLVGCGLGGTSLINANVAIAPDPRLFDDPCWPAELRAEVHTELAAGFARARDMLKPTAVPGHVEPAKLGAHQRSSAGMQATFARAEINVTFDELPGGVNHVGVAQQPCCHCGDCVTGCNHGAKNTTLMTYLPDAVNHGAEIFTQVEVRRISRGSGERYAVHFQVRDARREAFDAPDDVVTADLVVLAAGTLGSTEILLRSRDAGLAISDRIGQGFTGNGDVLGFAYNCDQRINGVGWGHRDPEHMKRDEREVGPCITSVIDLRAGGDVNDGMIIEEGALPGAIAGILPVPLALASATVGFDTDGGLCDEVREAARVAASLVGGAYHGAVHNTQTYLVMSHEGSAGEMALADDRVRISWPGIGDAPVFGKIDARLRQATAALGGTFVRNPLWTELFQHRLITVHPLGGCAMASTAAAGVVNHKGQVFTGDGGVYDGLYVADGAVIPRSLGCNPLLTISALAERTCARIAADRGWTIDYALPSVPRRPPPVETLGVEFTERMAGHFSTVDDDFAAAEQHGRDAGSTFEVILTIVAEDLARLVSDERYVSGMVGTARAPALSPQPMAVTNGEFTLLVTDPDNIGGKNMRYRMKLSAADGRAYWFEGTKYIQDDPGLDLWADCTTLYITVTEGDAPGGARVGRGVLHIAPADFLQQLRATRAINARDTAERLAAVARFGAYFARNLWDVYGGVFARATAFGGDAPPRKKRALRAPAPEVHDLATDDGAVLRLTRYGGAGGGGGDGGGSGGKGPVLLAHDLGCSSALFSLDTIETNLVEHLVERRYDVWLLDSRASIDRPAHRTPFTGDDLARHDWPAAVARVRAISRAETIQVVAHGFGAATFAMAMCDGLAGVRAAVLSQLATHVRVRTGAKLEAGLHLPEVLEALGVTDLTAYAGSHAGWRTRLFEAALRLWPAAFHERCRSPVCHRIAFLFGPLYEHAQLDTPTHEALHELFGDAPIAALEHLGRMVRAGQLVGADGTRYVDRLSRLALPTLLLHGAENAAFLPASTEDALAVLQAANPATPYTRRVVSGYGHHDCLIGKHAVRDVYPHIVAHLDAT